MTTSQKSPPVLDIDVQAIHATISHHEQAILSLEGEMETHMRTIRQLQHRKHQHLAEIRRCKGMITLAKRLPPEILASVFEECVSDGWTRTPLVVSHVCSSWRKASRIPTVWSHIYVNLEARDPYRRTRLWLDNSKDTLLRIDIEVPHDLSRLGPVMTLLAKEMGRWKTLFIKAKLADSVNQIIHLCNKPAPQLRSVDISIEEGCILLPNEAEDHLLDLVALRGSFRDSLNLQSFRIDQSIIPSPTTLPSSITDLYLRLSNQHVLSIHSMSRMLLLLEEHPILTSFSLHMPTGYHQEFNVETGVARQVELPLLKSLTLMGSNNIFAILPYLILPALESLHLRSSLEYLQAEETGACIAQFLTRSSPPLRSLELRDLGLDPVVIGGLFYHLASLEELCLHDSDINDISLQSLNGPDGLCPLLSRLDFRWCGRLSGRALVDLVRSRMPTSDPSSSKSISEITVINCSFVKEQDILDMAAMSVCRLVIHGTDDFCYTFGCCENDRYRKRLKQRNVFGPLFANADLTHRIVL
ncbi:hypothetical protein B0H34DRAFT_793825 [Crassisporium funariophilum]|nr:hypothetical protein B0H34DRAFT_793825 [Crassisporium funariophilum]